ncbi:hypothetical protein B0H66DRAFT_626323 [Apodospora peruviana]|uniref:Uncharacterized protein n=1 Tax=Apodospora peruviana TaxID=516989 RepID=A0AAE0I384_9PEZI|nr:hypothetical protein B0H66DRAFT_626323 [Apodospora peruviana]
MAYPCTSTNEDDPICLLNTGFFQLIPTAVEPKTLRGGLLSPVTLAVETTECISTEDSSPATVPTGKYWRMPLVMPSPSSRSPTSPAPRPTTSWTSSDITTSHGQKKTSPFAFGKKEKPTSGEETEKPKSPPIFSKNRATIKGHSPCTRAEVFLSRFRFHRKTWWQQWQTGCWP